MRRCDRELNLGICTNGSSRTFRVRAFISNQNFIFVEKSSTSHTTLEIWLSHPEAAAVAAIEAEEAQEADVVDSAIVDEVVDEVRTYNK